MVKAINGWAFADGRSPGDMIRLAKDAGFAGLELTIGETGGFTLAATQEECARIRGFAEEMGVQILSLASGLGWAYPITADDEVVRKKGIHATEKCLQIARWLGVDAILLVPGGVYADFIDGFPRTTYADAYPRAVEGLRKLARTAGDLDVHVCVENVWNMFLLSPLEMKTLLEEVGSSHVGSYFDVGNVVVNGFPEDWIDILGPWIRRVHFKDFKRSIGTLDGFCDLLEGDVDYAAVMRSLAKAGYDGPVTAEFFNCEQDLPKISAAMDRILEMK